MRVASVNIGRPESIAHGNRSFSTGIRKRSAPGSVSVGRDLVDGDTICNLEHHGGVDQVVYAYSSEDYAWWSGQLGRKLEPGTFGENLTIDGLPSNMIVGDRLLIGDVLLEATSPRIPCSTLAAQMQDSGFGMAFRKAERPGIYFRVLNEGEVAAGDTVTFVENPVPIVSILDLFRLAYERHPNCDGLECYLEAPLAERVRASIEHKLTSADDSAA
jgi:MOSC domain-containing protein YiiM